MPDPEKPTPAAPPKRSRFRRALRWIGLFVLVLAIFHRPLFHAGVRLVLIKVAARQNVNLDVTFSGNIFSNLTVSKIRATPTGKAPSPVRKIVIEKVQLDYDLISLARHGIGEFLRSYEIVNADLEFEALPSKSEPERKQKRALAQDLNNLLGQPAAYSDRVHIENFNITVHAEKNVTQVAGFDLLLDPEKIGYLRAARLQVPGLPVWENLASETSYESRNFFVNGLRLDDQLIIDEVNFDASQRAQDKGGMYLKARAFGGRLFLSLAGSQLDQKGENLAKSYDTTLRISADDVSLEAAAAYFGAPRPPAAKLTRLEVLFTGEPEKPRTWKGKAEAGVAALALGASKFDGLDLAATFERGIAQLTGFNIAAGRNTVSLTATVGLPASVNDFPASDVDAMLRIDAPELADLSLPPGQPMTGALFGGGPLKLNNGRLTTDLTLDVKTLAGKGFAVKTGKVAVHVEKQVNPTPASPFDGLSGRVQADIKAIATDAITLDMLRADVEVRNRLVVLHSTEIRRAENAVTAEGNYRIPDDLRDAATAPLETKILVTIPNLEDFGIKVGNALLKGHLNGGADLALANNLLNGDVQLIGGDFQLDEFKTGSLTTKVLIKENVASVEQLALQLNASDQIAVTGQANVQSPFPYEGALLVDIGDLAALQPLLAVFGAKQSLAGTLHLDWEGKGEAAPIKPPLKPGLDQSGQLHFALTKGRFDKIDLTEIRIGGLYGPGFAQSTEFQLVTGPTSFTSSIEVKEGKLRLKDMNLAQGDLAVLTGYAFLPLDLDNLKRPIPLDKRIAANINANNLDLDKLLGSFGQSSPASGTISANLVTGGTLLQPFGHLKFAGRKLQAKAVRELDGADLDLDLHYSNKDLTLAALIKQPQLQPLTIKGHAPLDLEAAVQNTKLDPELPIDLTVQLPSSSLAVVPKLTTQVRKIDGTLALDVRVAGTVGKPVLSGTAALDLKGARFDNVDVPALGAFKVRLGFNEDLLTVQNFEGEVGGGTLKVGGTIKFPSLPEPVFDLRLQSDEVLVKRDDSITVRADTDITFAGPLNAAALGGTVFITHSRFFKEIDILPIALPGKAKPAPKAARSINTGVSFPNPP